MSDAPLSMHVIGEIKSWIGRRDLNKSELARRLQVSHTWVSNRLAGHQEISLNDLERIATALEVDVSDLLPKPALRDERATRGINPDYRRTAPRPRSAHLIEVAHGGRSSDDTRSADARSPRVTGPRSRPSWADAGGAA